MTQQTLPITRKQQEILTLIPRFRFINRPHIQSLLHHKDKQQINRWLYDLTEKQYIRRIYDHTNVGKNRIPAIYYLHNQGVQYVKSLEIYDKTFLSVLYRDKKRSVTFISHCLRIATMCCELEKKSNVIAVYSYTTQSDRSDPNNPLHFLNDIAITLDISYTKKQKGKKEKQYLLTLFDETLPRYRVRSIIRQYRDFYLQGEWEEQTGTPFPIILFVFESKERMIYAKRYVKILFADDTLPDLSINFALAGDVQVYGVTGEIWEVV